MYLLWKCQKTKKFWDNFSIWLQSCQILQPGSYLDMTTAFGLTPDSSSLKLHINFCCPIAKNFIWICRPKECFPNSQQFLVSSKTRNLNLKMYVCTWLVGGCGCAATLFSLAKSHRLPTPRGELTFSEKPLPTKITLKVI